MEGASSYQIEVDGGKTLESAKKDASAQSGLPAEKEHSLRVRAAKGNSVSERSDAVKGKAQKELRYEGAWKECTGDFSLFNKYSVDKKNTRIAAKINNGYYCAIVENTPLPLNAITSWSIKILKSRSNDGNGIFIGVVPSDIDQDEDRNYKCGLYFDCYYSALHSGPPHNYSGKAYGPRKGDGEYVHTGDSVGVVIDTAKRELSFVLNGVNLGVAYERVPLERPLVPCVLLRYSDSVELVI